jgi:hypothetical protein
MMPFEETDLSVNRFLLLSTTRRIFIRSSKYKVSPVHMACRKVRERLIFTRWFDGALKVSQGPNRRH